MLSSIHPLGEAGRRQSWTTTVAAHIVGSACGGALVGGALGAFGMAIAWLGAGRPARLFVAAAVALGATAVDAAGWPRWLWRPHRQVNEDWMVRYRGWVYGGGYGFQLGAGITTIVTAATVYAIGALAVASGTIWAGGLLGLAFGVARGTTVLWARSVHDAEALLRFHRRLQARAPLGRAAAVAADAAVALAATAGLWTFRGA